MDRFYDYPVLGGSHDGLTFRLPEKVEPGRELPCQMRVPGPPQPLIPDPQGRMELYRLENDGKFYFLGVYLKDGKRITPEGKREPSRITNGIPYFDYRFMGGSHDGNNMSFPKDFEAGFTLGLDMRGEHGPQPSGKQEVYKLEPDCRFHYQNAIMKDGKQISPPPNAEGR